MVALSMACYGLNFAELEPLDYMPVNFRFEDIGALEREFIGSVVTRKVRHAGCNASYAAATSARYKISRNKTSAGIRKETFLGTSAGVQSKGESW